MKITRLIAPIIAIAGTTLAAIAVHAEAGPRVINSKIEVKPFELNPVPHPRSCW